MRLKGKTVVVTGAGRGIGRQIAKMMAAEGARVLAVDRDTEALGTLEGIATFAADLTNEKAVADMAAHATELGPLHILVNAAAVVRFGWIDELSYSDWQLTLRSEVDSVFLVTRALWPQLKMKGGSIINFSSASAHVALQGLPAVAHTAGKGAVLAMTRQLAMEGGPWGIRANSIAPGFTVTEETEQHLDNPEMMASVRSKLMIDRLGRTEDIGYLAIYLGSDESGFVTGADFSIDGGATAW
ncbi:MAG: oxidoreductase [Hoeflea sp.]|uniref:SDR family NAD(P)-dependent oxidoreductase n=1 Tax=Hoeflea sp. TaxID=1940281 RepID=UPI000C0EF6B6|nr:SDR family oxidoreductase [Hoeflea sp.]PHR25432.1 MAG: oxidoreductase [Hoeflea sp.]